MADCKAGHLVYKDDDEYDSVFQIKTTPASNFKDKVRKIWANDWFIIFY